MRPGVLHQFLVPEPGRLALGVALCVGLGPGARLGQCQMSLEVREELGHAVRAQGRQGGIEPQQLAHLGQRACVQHGAETLDDGRAELGARWIEQDEPEGPGRGRGLRGLPGGKPTAGTAPDFPGAGKALAVGGAQARGRRGIDLGEGGVQFGGAALGEQAAGFRPRRVARWRDVGDAMREGGEIEPGAAAEDGQAAPHARLGHRGQRRLAPPGGVGGFGHTSHAVERMRYAGFVRRRRARGDDAQLAIGLHGVRVDHRAAEALGKGQRERRFSARGGAGDDEGFGQRCLGVLPCHRRHRIGRAMNHVLTLIADRATGPLNRALVTRVHAALGAGEPVVLSPGEAVDLPLAALPAREAVAAALEGAAVDAIAQPASGRRKKLLLADMDSTIVTTETLDELAAHAGLKEEIAAITRRSMNGEIDFREALRERVAMLKGLLLAALEATWERTEYTPGARELIATMRAHGATTALVSGGFTFFTGRVAEELGFHHHRSNVLLHDGERLTGEVAEPILDRDAKLSSLREFAAGLGIGLEETAAVGDGANDLAMLRAAGLGVAFRAKPVVAAEARAELRHAGLRGVLFAQGYRVEEIVG